MRHQDYLDDLFAFIAGSPTAFHTCTNAALRLDSMGFTELREADSWPESGPDRYYVRRNQSSLIAFVLTEDGPLRRPLRLAGAHSDSPALQLKPQPLRLRQGLVELGLEVYGGPLLATWFDRELALAGRICWQRSGGPLHCDLVDTKRPLVILPNLALHLDREAASGRSIDRQAALFALLQQSEEPLPSLEALLLQEPEIARTLPQDATILSFELFLYDPAPPSRIGLQGEWICGPRLDNLLSCHALIQALAQASPCHNALVVLNDHEEIGSLTAAGAQGSFLSDVLQRLLPDPALRRQVLADSLLVSADNAHAVHPNFAERHDPEHQPRLNQGPVIKHNAARRYATDSVSAGLFRRFCAKAGVPCQSFVMRNDLACGSTIGPLTAAALGLRTVDLGLPQLAMHSIRETAGSQDGLLLLRALKTFFAAEDEELRVQECY